MKHILFTLVGVITLILISGSLLVSGAIDYTSPKLTVTLISQSPDPVEPGEIVTVKFKIENEGAQSAEDAIVKIIPKQPFSLYGDVAEKNIGKLRATSTGADAEIVEYKLKVADDAVEAETEIELFVYIGKTGYSYGDDQFNIDIETRDAILDISSIKIEPQQIPPGQEGSIKITLKNLADSIIKDITLDLDFSSVSLPIAPYQSLSKKQIASLEPSHQLPLTFRVMATPDAAPGLYKIPFNLTYFDEQGNDYLIKEILGISIGEAPKLNIYLKKSTVQQNKKSGLVTLEVANAGASKIKFLGITLLPSDDYKLINPSNYFYLGDVDSDDTESEEINIYVKSKEEKVEIPVKLDYYDSNNNIYKEKVDLSLQLYSTSEMKRFGLISSNNTFVYILMIILTIAGVFIYKKKPKYLPEFLRKRIGVVK